MPSPEPSLLDHIPDDTSPDTLLFAFLEWAEGRGLELYPHQEEAIISIFGGDNVVLATPTGSGKSMVRLPVRSQWSPKESVRSTRRPSRRW